MPAPTTDRELLDALGAELGLTAPSVDDIDGNIYDILDHPHVAADLAAVPFNVSGENFQHVPEADPDFGAGAAGIRTTPGGRPYICCAVFGDWQVPAFAALWHDGRGPRVHVPAVGNVFNRTTHAAYGNARDGGDLRDLLDRLGPGGAKRFPALVAGTEDMFDCLPALTQAVADAALLVADTERALDAAPLP